MARIKRHAARRLWRRSREEKRRLSEGGGTAREQPPVAADEQSDPKNWPLDSGRCSAFFSDMDDRHGVELDLPAEEVDKAYHYLFHFNEVYGLLLLKEEGIRHEMEKLHQLKASIDEKKTNMQLMIRSPDSEKIKKVKAIIRRSDEIQDTLRTLEEDLRSAKLNQTIAEANYKSYARIVSEDVAGEGADLLFGFIGHVFRSKE